MVSVNCAAVPESLLESELFGHEEGAFSGATSAKPGLLESADGGTFFLDEISESSPRTQAELLRVLETKRLRRVGAVKERSVDVRIIAASNRSLPDEIARGNFREDLYYRLNAALITVPPLRDRKLDIPAMARAFLAEECHRLGRDPMTITEGATQRLLAHTWPGNVRELKNLMLNMVAVVREQELDAEHLPDHVGPNCHAARAAWDQRTRAASSSAPASFRRISEEIKDLERTRMEQALEATEGVRVRAAELIGMPLRTFVTKLKLHGLSERWQSNGRTRKGG